MQDKIMFTTVVSVVVAAKGPVRFSEDFIKRITGIAAKLGNQHDIVTSTTSDEREIVVLISGGDFDRAAKFKADFESMVLLTAEHGSDVDLLEALLERYASVQDHPRLQSVIGAWDQLISKVREVAKDTKGPVQANKDVIRNIVSQTAVAKGIGVTKAEKTLSKADLRELSLRGQAPGQEVPVRAPGDPKIPEQYHAIARKGKMPDSGNVF